MDVGPAIAASAPVAPSDRARSRPPAPRRSTPDAHASEASKSARLLTRNAAERRTAGLRCDVEAGMAKLFASETALELATEAMRIHGGMGYSTELPVERYYRDAPLMVIGEGTNEIQHLVIARGLLQRWREERGG